MMRILKRAHLKLAWALNVDRPEDSGGGLQRTPEQARHFHAGSLQTSWPNAAAADGSPGVASLKEVTQYLATASDVSV